MFGFGVEKITPAQEKIYKVAPYIAMEVCQDAMRIVKECAARNNLTSTDNKAVQKYCGTEADQYRKCVEKVDEHVVAQKLSIVANHRCPVELQSYKACLEDYPENPGKCIDLGEEALSCAADYILDRIKHAEETDWE
mmetsp:Transcript_10302/g.17578  ORF Transcript_10302/g.17578 Transcript_10302/m.17578 type:complete len:137 (-) Transcript_10302:25-435(-)|eukprot:CAMPEP_0206158890 /NCGR_PEP_ID=MMETSP1474-20131121/5262_1 /ASSEMBLY_ACC=CAM_ASM_001110 /TAXON_ID=97495 /ORGANISM="Imantonia sp., Strain RCC918" /LENGTH=136 /DNA_ID=CAMNT_0053559215 /DNA_START=13 /DNA_END=423 /DNA_ORIENTATION=-